MSPITRETLIDPSYKKIAATKTKMMFGSISDDGELLEVEIPISIKESGTIPEGYSVDFLLDPLTLVRALVKQGVTEKEDLKPELLAGLMGQINDPENLKIIPTELWEAKMEMLQSSGGDSE